MLISELAPASRGWIYEVRTHAPAAAMEQEDRAIAALKAGRRVDQKGPAQSILIHGELGHLLRKALGERGAHAGAKCAKVRSSVPDDRIARRVLIVRGRGAAGPACQNIGIACSCVAGGACKQRCEKHPAGPPWSHWGHGSFLKVRPTLFSINDIHQQFGFEAGPMIHSIRVRKQSLPSVA